MIITTNTGTENSLKGFCKCGDDYAGDRIILEDEQFIPILGRERQCGIDFSSFYKNISQANLIKFKLNPKQSRIITDIDGNGIKFLAISVIDPASPIYWRKTSTNPLFEFVTVIMNGSFKITTSPFVSDMVNANIEFTFNSDNTFKLISWSNLAASFVNGELATTWLEADASWNSYDPLLTSNTKFVVVNKVISTPFVIEQDSNGDFTGEVLVTVPFGTSEAKIVLKFHGNYPLNTFEIDELTISLDGHYVGSLFIQPGTLTTDFITTPYEVEVNYSFLAASSLIEEYDKIVGMMVLTSTDNEPLADIKLFNGGIKSVQIQTLIGS